MCRHALYVPMMYILHVHTYEHDYRVHTYMRTCMRMYIFTHAHRCVIDYTYVRTYIDTVFYSVC